MTVWSCLELILMAKFINLLIIKTSAIRKCVVEPKSPDNGDSTVSL